MEQYNIGTSTNQIKLHADINTIGLAASRAIVLLVSGTGSGTAVAHSVNATGDIPRQNIGGGQALKGLRLSVFTKISLTGVDQSTREIEAKQVTASYTLDGGDDGVQTYNTPIVTYLDPNVFLNFLVDLV